MIFGRKGRKRQCMAGRHIRSRVQCARVVLTWNRPEKYYSESDWKGTWEKVYASNNYSCDEPIEIRLVCENGKAVISYEHAELTYNDGTVETVKNQPQKIVTYSNGKAYKELFVRFIIRESRGLLVI